MLRRYVASTVILLIIVPNFLTPTLVCRRLPPDSATFLLSPLKGHSVSAHLSTDTVSERPHKGVSTNKTERNIESRHARPSGIKEMRVYPG